MDDLADLKRTPMHDLHVQLGARMVGFAGYSMPVSYPLGVMKEHLHCRAQAGLFDVSHMGQVRVVPHSGRIADATGALEALIPVDLRGLSEGRQRYGFFTNENGGLLDDLMIARMPRHYHLVVNAACKDDDIDHLRAHVTADCQVEVLSDRALLAIQGPRAEDALARIAPDVRGLSFMAVGELESDYGDLIVSRSGYTGEDGFEVSVTNATAVAFARALLAMDEVEPIGLGARDSLRLEAGLCLYGSDIDQTTTPVAAGLTWAIGKDRRFGGQRSGGFPGEIIILSELDTGPERKRVGLRPEGRAPMRSGTDLYATESGGNPVGSVTSGGFGPSVDVPVAMGYVPAEMSAPGTRLWGEVRGKRLPAVVSKLPFHPHSYKR